MFGKKTVQDKKAAKIAQVVNDNTPDLVVDKPANMGMPGFTDDAVAPAQGPVAESQGIPGFGSIGAPVPAQEEPAQAPAAEPQGIPGFGSIGAPAPMQEEPAPAPTPAPVPAPTPAPAPADTKPVEQYQIVEVAIGPEGLYVYKIVTNKYLGELGGVYEV